MIIVFFLQGDAFSRVHRALSFGKINKLSMKRQRLITRLLCKGKCHCTTDLLFYLFGSTYFTYYGKLTTDLLVWSDPNLSNKRSAIQ